MKRFRHAVVPVLFCFITLAALNSNGYANDLQWTDIGVANNVAALSTSSNKIYAACNDNTLWVRDAAKSVMEWRYIGHANSVAAMTASNEKLYAVGKDGTLWVRSLVEYEVPWHYIGQAEGIESITFLNGKLLARDSRAATLLVRDIAEYDVPWVPLNLIANIRCLASMNGHIFALTTYNSLKKTDVIGYANQWEQVATNAMTNISALSAMSGSLYAATSTNRLLVSDIPDTELQKDIYQVGVSKVSIDPDVNQISVPLAGFYELSGRFSLKWANIGQANGVVGLTAINGKFYAAGSDNCLWVRDAVEYNVPWKKIGHANGAVALTALNGKLYAAASDNTLWVRDPVEYDVPWKNIGHANGVVGLAALNGKLYAAASDNTLWVRDPVEYDVPWKNIGHANGVVSMTSLDGKLYAASNDNTLWVRDGVEYDVPWVKIGNANGVKGMATLNSKLYVANTDNALWVARHNSEGIFSSAVAIKDQFNNYLVMVNADLLGLEYSLYDEVRTEISTKRNIPVDAILINVSHTHYAPVSQNFNTWPTSYSLNQTYMTKVLKPALIKSIEQALDSMESSYLFIGKGTTNLGYNRSSEDPGIYDNTLDIIKVTDIANTTRAVLMFHGCHPVWGDVVSGVGSLENTISPNYPGIAKDALHNNYGIQHAFFFQGFGGDINPADNFVVTGNVLADSVQSLLNAPLYPLKGAIRSTLHKVDIPLQPANTPEEFMAIYNANVGINSSDAVSDTLWSKYILSLYDISMVPTTLPTYVHIVDFGNVWRIVGVSREVVTEYGPAIREIWPGKFVTVMGYTNDVTSYLPNKWHIEQMRYEATRSFKYYGQPSSPQIGIFDIMLNSIRTY